MYTHTAWFKLYTYITIPQRCEVHPGGYNIHEIYISGYDVERASGEEKIKTDVEFECHPIYIGVH